MSHPYEFTGLLSPGVGIDGKRDATKVGKKVVKVTGCVFSSAGIDLSTTDPFSSTSGDEFGYLRFDRKFVDSMVLDAVFTIPEGDAGSGNWQVASLVVDYGKQRGKAEVRLRRLSNG